MLITAIILFTGVLIWDAAADYRKFLRNRKVKHTSEGWLRAALLLPSLVCFTVANDGNWIETFLSACAMEFFVWWLLFDGIYNTLTGQGIFHVGTTSGMDTMQSQWSIPVRAAVKIGGALIFIGKYISLL